MSSNEMSRNLFSYNDRKLNFAGIDLNQLPEVQDYSEPFIIYKKSLIIERIKWVKSWQKLHQLHFAVKANFHPHILKLFLDHHCGLDVVSGGELRAGIEVGFKPQDFIFSGVGKTKHELEFAIDLGIYQINVESPSELKRIAEISRAQNKKVAIGLRVNPLIDTPTHPYISTALKDSKFGIDLQDVPECLEVFKNNQQLSFKCLSFHIGSQILEPQIFRETVDKMKVYFLDLKKNHSTLDRMDIGGGLGIDYKDHNIAHDFSRWLHLIGEYDQALTGFNADIVSELGRFMVARSGIFISQVQYIKNKNMLVLDLGMNNNMRPSLYQAHHHFYNLVKHTDHQKKYSLVGPICESSDVFHKSFELFETQENDLLVMADCGAYVRSMASEYNLKNMAREIFID